MDSGTLEATYSVLTPEYVEFEFTAAGLYSRFLAWVLDTLVTAALAFCLMVAISLLSVLSGSLSMGLGFIVWFAVDWGYALVLEWLWSGQTVGKRALGLRVIQTNGVRAGFVAIALRNLVRPVDRLPAFYLVGAVAALGSGLQQRLGDMLADTVVVRERNFRIPSLLNAPELPGLLADATFSRGLFELTAEEQDVLVSAALRREELATAPRLQLFSRLAERLESEYGLVRPAHLSHEKFVLAITAWVLNRKRALHRAVIALPIPARTLPAPTL